MDELDEQAKTAAQESVKYAKDSPNPEWEELYTDVYVNPFPPFGPTRNSRTLPGPARQ